MKKSQNREKKYSDPFLDEVHALKKAVWDASGHDIRRLVDMANESAARWKSEKTHTTKPHKASGVVQPQRKLKRQKASPDARGSYRLSLTRRGPHEC